MPPPLSIKGVTRAVVALAKGHHVTAFIDELAERLAFERTGTRLYEALIAKLDAAADPLPEGPRRTQLDLVGVVSSGLLAVVTDARVTFTAALKAVLIAELADNDGWQSLAKLAAKLEHDAMATAFRTALAEEQEHLASIRSWRRKASTVRPAANRVTFENRFMAGDDRRDAVRRQGYPRGKGTRRTAPKRQSPLINRKAGRG